MNEPFRIPPIDQESAKLALLLFADIMADHCPFFLIDGTLLGAVRDGGFITYDTDIDVGVWSEDFQQPALDALTENGFRVRRQIGPNDRGLSVSLVWKNIYIDVFPFTRGEYFSTDMKMPKIHLRTRLRPFGLAPIEFLGHHFLAPDPPEQYLEDGYGPDWRTPVQNWSYRYSPPNLFVVGGPVSKLRYAIKRWYRLNRLRHRNE